MPLVERTSGKFSSQGQGRGLLKYTNYGVCISLEKKLCLLESLGFHKYCGQTFFHQTNFWHQTHKKCCHVGKG
jgi:hypothetical protein